MRYAAIGQIKYECRPLGSSSNSYTRNTINSKAART